MRPGTGTDATAPAGPPARRARARPAGAPGPPAETLPVARVLVDVPLPHLDRPFDYLVPAAQADQAVPGARVRVRFAGQDVDGFVLSRRQDSEHGGRLSPLRRVVSPEPVLSAEVARLARRVADRYAGTVADVLRLAVPPRHAAEERAQPAPRGAPPPVPPPGPWADLEAGPAFLTALAGGAGPRAVLTAPPGAAWADLLARAAVATAAGGRGALVVVPDGRDVAALDGALRSLAGQATHVVLTADLGPRQRYRRWLQVSRGTARVVVGTRAAAFAPVADLGLVVCWDDGDDLHGEPRAPYPHAREVLLLRAHDARAGCLVGGFAQTAEAAALVGRGWARRLQPPRALVRERAPRVLVAGDDDELGRDPAARAARLPSLAWRTVHGALGRGPVLVQAPRAGYLPGLACQACRTRARCGSCGGPLALGDDVSGPACAWCGAGAPRWRCPGCGATTLRAATVGSRRTAEELGRAFPGTVVRTADRDGQPGRVDAGIVVATPGAEPPAEAGYAAAVLLDGDVMASRPVLRAGEEALRRWLAAASLVRSGAAGGVVVVVAGSTHPAVQALVRWDPVGFAERELAERTALGFPPAVRLAELTGPLADVEDLLSLVTLPARTDVTGPLPVPAPARSAAAHERLDDPDVRVLLRVPHVEGPALSRALRAGQGVRSVRHTGQHVRVRVDPVDLG